MVQNPRDREEEPRKPRGTRTRREAQTLRMTILGRILAATATIALVVVGVLFSVVLLAFALVAGAGLAGYIAWKTRKLRKAMRESEGRVIEGEAVRESVERIQVDRRSS